MGNVCHQEAQVVFLTEIPTIKPGSVKDLSDIPDVLSAIDETGVCPFCRGDRPLSVYSAASQVTIFTQIVQNNVLKDISKFCLNCY